MKYLSTAVLVLGLAIGSSAETRVLAAGAAGHARAQYGAPSMPVTMSLRGGLMVSPRSAGHAGIDIAVPSVSIMDGWEGRIDADVIFKANFSSVSTAVPVTFSLVRYSDNVRGHSAYLGIGAGTLLGGKSKLLAKGILCVEVGPKLGVEGNILFSESKTMVLLTARLHL